MHLNNLLIIAMLLMIAVLSSCGKGNKENDVIRPVGITITGNTTNTTVGNSFAVNVTLQFSDASGSRVTNNVSWRISDSAIASISNKGVINCLTDGTSLLTATFENFKNSFNITCNKRPFVEEITATVDSKALEQGQSLEIEASALLNNGTVIKEGIKYNWKSSNEDIATINSEGVITAITFGEVDITIGINKDEQTAAYNFDSVESIVIAFEVLPSAISLRIAPSKEKAALQNTNFNIELEFGDEAYLKVFQVLANNELREITSSVVRNVAWKYDTTIVNINVNGEIELKSEGKTTINLPDFSGVAAENSVSIIVEKPLEIFVKDENNNRITLIWKKKFDSSEYQLRWKTTDTPIFSNPIILNETTYNVNNVDASKTYTFEVAYKKSDSSFSEYASIEVKPHLNSLRKLKPFPNQVDGASITLNDKVYLFGGKVFNEDGASYSSDEVWEYDIKTDIWMKLPVNLSEPRQDAAICELNGTIYLIGGYNSSSQQQKYLSTVIAYHLISGKWLPVNQLGFTFPAIRYATCSSNTSNSELYFYLVGGLEVVNNDENNLDVSNKIYRFSVDPTASEKVTQISTTALLSQKRYRHQSIISMNRLYTIGGLSEVGEISSVSFTVDVIDLTTQTLLPAVDFGRMNTPRFDFKAFLTDNKIVIVAGLDNEKDLVSPAEYFDLDSASKDFNSWVSDINIPFDDAPIISEFNSLDQKLYVFHHFNENTSQANLISTPINFSNIPSNINWRFLRRSFKNITNTTSGVIGDNVFLFGGKSSRNITSDVVQIFNATTNTWVTDLRGPADMKFARENAASVSVNNSIFVISGKDSNNQYLSTFEIYNLVADSNLWTLSNKPLTSPRSNACAVYFDNYIYLFGGENGNGLVRNVERFGPITPSIGNAQWTNFAIFEAPRAGLSCAVVGDAIYLVGGYEEIALKSATNKVISFLPNVNRLWLDVQNLNRARIKPAIEVLNKNIYIFAGRSSVLSSSSGHKTSEVFAYSDIGRGWTLASFGNLNTQSNNPSSALIGNKIILFANDTRTVGTRKSNLSNVYILD